MRCCQQRGAPQAPDAPRKVRVEIHVDTPDRYAAELNAAEAREVVADLLAADDEIDRLAQ